MSSTYFSDAEIACPCCGRNNASQVLLRVLDALRAQVGHPLHVNSFCRCEAHNAEVGGVPTSSHLKGLAVDLSAPDCIDKGEIIRLWAWITEQNELPYRAGIGERFLHLDIDENKSSPCIWPY